MSYLKHSIVTFLNQIFLMCLGMGTGIIIARCLGPELKGQVSLLTNLSQILFMLGSMGLGSAFSFFIAKKYYSGRAIMTFALASAIGFGLITIFIFFLTWPLHESVWANLKMGAIAAFLGLSVIYIYCTYLMRIIVGHGKIYTMNIADLVRSIVNFGTVVIFLLLFNIQLLGVTIALYLAVISQLLVFWWALRADLKPEPFWRGDLIGASFRYGLKSHALMVVNFLNYRLDIFLVKYFSDDTAVGFYSLAVGMAELMWLVPNATVAPLFSNVAQSDAKDRSIVTLRTCRWSLLFLVILAIGAILLGRPFIALLYGVQFLPSYNPFLWLLPGICLFPVYKLLTIDLAARGFPGYGTIASIIALVTNIGLNVVLIPRYNIIGAAAASSVSYSLMSLCALYFFIKKTRYSLREILVIPAAEAENFMNLVAEAVKKVVLKK